MVEHVKKAFRSIWKIFQRVVIFQWGVSRTKKIMKYYNFIRSLKIREERRCFLRQIFHKSHVKNGKLKNK